MVYQKTVIKLPLRCAKDRSKAMQIATQTDGIIYAVEIQGQHRDQLVVIGEIDPAKLTESLRKKFRFATLMSVQPITTSETGTTSSSSNNNQNEYYQIVAHHQPRPSSSYYYDAHYPYGYRVVHESDPSTCSIM